MGYGLFSKVTQEYGLFRPYSDYSRLASWLAITLPILHRIMDSGAQFCHISYDISLFQAMCSLAFFPYMRIGEIIWSPGDGIHTTAHIHQLTKLVDNSQVVAALKFTFVNFKHHYNQRPFSVVIRCPSSFCPVNILLQYLSLRGSKPGPLFVLVDGLPVTQAFFSDKLSMAIKYCGLDPSRYKGHSFRIGAASHAADTGMSDAQIRALARWKSNAFLKYIRIPSLPS